MSGKPFGFRPGERVLARARFQLLAEIGDLPRSQRRAPRFQAVRGVSQRREILRVRRRQYLIDRSLRILEVEADDFGEEIRLSGALETGDAVPTLWIYGRFIGLGSRGR